MAESIQKTRINQREVITIRKHFYKNASTNKKEHLE